MIRRALERLLLTQSSRSIFSPTLLVEILQMHMFLLLLGIGFLSLGYSVGAEASEVELPIDNEMKASIVAAKKHFHLQACVSSEFSTSLNEFETYWAVTLTDDGRDGPVTCEPATVYVCKSRAAVVFEDPTKACSKQ